MSASSQAGPTKEDRNVYNPSFQITPHISTNTPSNPISTSSISSKNPYQRKMLNRPATAITRSRTQEENDNTTNENMTVQFKEEVSSSPSIQSIHSRLSRPLTALARPSKPLTHPYAKPNHASRPTSAIHNKSEVAVGSVVINNREHMVPLLTTDLIKRATTPVAPYNYSRTSPTPRQPSPSPTATSLTSPISSTNVHANESQSQSQPQPQLQEDKPFLQWTPTSNDITATPTSTNTSTLRALKRRASQPTNLVNDNTHLTIVDSRDPHDHRVVVREDKTRDNYTRTSNAKNDKKNKTNTSAVPDNNSDEYMRVRLWWLEQQASMLDSKANERDRAVQTIAVQRQNIQNIHTELKQFKVENQKLQEVVRDMYAERDSRLKEIKSDLQREYYLQRMAIIEENRQLSTVYRENNERILKLEQVIVEKDKQLSLCDESSVQLASTITHLKQQCFESENQRQHWEHLHAEEERKGQVLSAAIVEKDEQISTLHADYKQVTQELQTTVDDIRAAELKYEQLLGIHKETLATVKRLEKDVYIMNTKVAAAEDKIHNDEKTVLLAQGEISKHKEINTTLQNRVNDLEEQIQGYITSHIQHQSEARTLKSQAEVQDAKISSLLQVIDELKLELRGVKTQHQELADERSQINSELTTVSKLHMSVYNELLETRQELGQYQNDSHNLKSKVSVLEDTITTLNKRIETSKADIDNATKLAYNTELQQREMLKKEQEYNLKIQELQSAKILLENNTQSQSLELRAITKQYIALHSEHSSIKSQFAAKNEALISLKDSYSKLITSSDAKLAAATNKYDEMVDKCYVLQNELIRVLLEAKSRNLILSSSVYDVKSGQYLQQAISSTTPSPASSKNIISHTPRGSFSLNNNLPGVSRSIGVGIGAGIGGYLHQDTSMSTASLTNSLSYAGYTNLSRTSSYNTSSSPKDSPKDHAAKLDNSLSNRLERDPSKLGINDIAGIPVLPASLSIEISPPNLQNDKFEDDMFPSEDEIAKDGSAVEQELLQQPTSLPTLTEMDEST